MTDQYLRIQYSDDGQPNFGNWDEEPIGEVGQYGLRIVFTRMGSTRTGRVYKLQCSSPRRRDMLAFVGVLQRTDG